MDILDGLTPQQTEAVTHVDGPLLVLAGAGSGKTRVITRRIAHLLSTGIPGWQVLAITFTNKAAGEMRDRTMALVGGGAKRPLVSTFHSFCARMLREYGEMLGLDPAYNIYDTSEQESAMKQALAHLALDATTFAPSDVLDTISAEKNRLRRPADFALHGPKEAKTPWGESRTKSIVRLYEAYDTILRQSHALDFDDLLMEVALGLQRNFAFRDALRDRFRYILIDEYQDTNHAQYVIARELAGDRKNLCATGDPDQSIYGWRGAEISNILDFEKDFPNAKTVLLEKNYRSTQVILKAASAVIANNRHRKKKDLYTDNPPGDPIEVVETDDEEAEANAIVRRITALRAEGLAFKEMAIFFRTVAQTRAIEDALRRARPPVPYEVLRGTSFYERKEVRDIIAYLLVLHNANDEVAVRRIINTPPRGIGDKSVDALSDWARKEGIALYHALPNVAEIADIPTRGRSSLVAFRDMMDELTKLPRERLAYLIEIVIKKSGYLNGLIGEEGHERKSNLDELITLGANFDKMAAEHPDDDALPRGLEGFLETVRLSSDQDDLNENVDRVPLMTLHTAKGLEFPAVFIPGCEDGLLPHERSRDLPRQMEEERRLFFVGVTRAKRRLTLLRARFRRVRGQLMRCMQSPFLGEMPSDTIKDLDETTGTRPEQFDRGAEGERQWDRRPERSESLGGGGYKAPGAQRIVQPEKDPKTGFSLSEVVRHAVYGVGRVTGFTTVGGRGFVKVRFNTVGEKTLDPTIAKLQKMATV